MTTPDSSSQPARPATSPSESPAPAAPTRNPDPVPAGERRVTDETAVHVPHMHGDTPDLPCSKPECHRGMGRLCGYCGGQPCRVRFTTAQPLNHGPKAMHGPAWDAEPGPDLVRPNGPVYVLVTPEVVDMLNTWSQPVEVMITKQGSEYTLTARTPMSCEHCRG